MTPEDSWVYVVTAVEVDGPRPGAHSMRSLASVAISADGTEHGRFHATLDPLPDAEPDPDPATMAWFAAQPEAWRAATTDPHPAQQVMDQWADWVRGLPRPRTFAASPIAFHGPWLDHYLRAFTPYALIQGPYEQDRLFDGPGLCLRSAAAAITGRPAAELSSDSLPPQWLGHVEHTHQALDNALGYAHLLTWLRAEHDGRTSFRAMQDQARQVRAAYAEAERAQFGRTWTTEEIMLGFLGDVGDLAKLVQGKEGVRPHDDLDTALAHELADCLWAVLTLADSYDVDLGAAFESTMRGLAGSI